MSYGIKTIIYPVKHLAAAKEQFTALLDAELFIHKVPVRAEYRMEKHIYPATKPLPLKIRRASKLRRRG